MTGFRLQYLDLLFASSGVIQILVDASRQVGCVAYRMRITLSPKQVDRWPLLAPAARAQRSRWTPAFTPILLVTLRELTRSMPYLKTRLFASADLRR